MLDGAFRQMFLRRGLLQFRRIIRETIANIKYAIFLTDLQYQQVTLIQYKSKLIIRDQIRLTLDTEADAWYYFQYVGIEKCSARSKKRFKILRWLISTRRAHQKSR